MSNSVWISFGNNCSTDFQSLFCLFWFLPSQEEEYPKILMGLFIEKPTPFVPEFLERMMELDYPKKQIDLLIHNTVCIACLI